MDDGFFSKLFDLSFSSFITTSIIKVLFVLTLIASGLATLFLFISLASLGAGGAVIGLLLAPLIFFFYAIFARVYMEILVVVFRIAEDVAIVANDVRAHPTGAVDSAPKAPETVGEQLRELAKLREDELITQDEFDEKQGRLIALL